MPRLKKEVRQVSIEPILLSKILIRCRGCGGFGFKAEMSTLACGTCDFHTAKCRACGGPKSVEAGVLHHVAYYSRRPERDKGVHTELWAIYQKQRKLKTREAKPSEAL